MLEGLSPKPGRPVGTRDCCRTAGGARGGARAERPTGHGGGTPAPARGEATPPPFWGLLGCPPMPRAPPRGLTVRWTEIQTPGPTVLPATWDFLEMARLGSTRGAERLRAGLGTGTLQWGGSPGVASEWQRWTQRGSPPSSPSGPALGFILFPTPASSEACLLPAIGKAEVCPP